MAIHAARRAGRNNSIDPSAPTVTPVHLAHPSRRADREFRGATTGVSAIARRGGKIATAMKHA